MNIFTGLSRTDYQDLFRAVGQMLDNRGLQDVRIWEHADGIIVQGCRTGAASYETIALTESDLHGLLHSAYQRQNRHG